MLETPDSLWLPVLWSKYGSPLLELKKGRSVSHTWRSIQHGEELLKLGVQDQALIEMGHDIQGVVTAW